MKSQHHIVRWIAGTIPGIILLFFLSACNSENAPDCFQATGDILSEELDVLAFDQIEVYENIRLVVRYGEIQKVELQTGANLRQEVTARVVNGVLQLRDGNDCNYFRAYGTTVFTVTSPDLRSIRSSTGFPVESQGVLPYESLSLLSESFNNPEAETTDGSFDLDLDVGDLSIVSNGLAYFSLRGEADVFRVTIAAGDSRVEAQELLASQVQLNHRGSNDILLHPVNILSGTLRGTGNALIYNRPGTVDVEQLFTGKLVYMD